MEGVASTARLKQANLRLLLDALQPVQEATKQALADATGLSLATCTVLLRELIDEGWVLELEHAAPRGGRPARRFALNPGHARLLCLLADTADGQPRILTCVYDLRGNPLRADASAHARVDPETLRAHIAACLEADPRIAVCGVALPAAARDGKVDGTPWGRAGLLDLGADLSAGCGRRVLVGGAMGLSAYGFRSTLLPDTPAETAVAIDWPWNGLPTAGLAIGEQIVGGQTLFAGTLAAFPLPCGLSEQLAGYRDAEGFMPLASRILQGYVSLLNPAVIAITGAAALRFPQADFERACENLVPRRHMPRFVLYDDKESATLSGLYHLCRAHLSVEPIESM